MNRTTITFKNQKITLVFGTWVMGQLLKRGFKLTEIKDEIQNNPFEFFTLLLYLAAVNGTADKNFTAFNQDDFFDWMDENGGITGEEVTRITEVFFISIVGEKAYNESKVNESKVVDQGKKPKATKKL